MNIKEKIEKWVGETLKIEKVVLVHPKEIKNGDYTLIVNDATAEEDFEKLNANKIEEISQIEFIKPRFINIYLSKNFFAESIDEINKSGEDFGKTNLLEDQKIMVEYTDPNPFKEFHIGHLMSNTIGESITRILEAQGAKTKRACYQGDVGLHVAKTIYGLQNNEWAILQEGSNEVKTYHGFHNSDTLEEYATILINNGPENITLSYRFISILGRAYVFGSNEYEKNENSRTKIIELNEKIYKRTDENINSLYDIGRKWSLEYFEAIYGVLGMEKRDSDKIDQVYFDHYFYESETKDMGKNLVMENLGLIFEESDGAIIFRGEKYDPKFHTRVFINAKGFPTYEAKELGLLKLKIDRSKKFGIWKETPDRSIVITGNEIKEYFKIVLKAAEQIEELKPLASRTLHLPHGMLRLPTGKMSSRTGDVITGVNLLVDIEKIIEGKIENKELAIDDKKNIAREVALASVKYSILRQAIGGDIIFDFEKSISFEGDSGPYLQYSAVRANSVLGKVTSNESQVTSNVPEGWETTELERVLYRFPEVVDRAGREYAPHHLVTYLTELASLFNSFYAKEKIIDESDPSSPYKVALTQAVSHTLTNGLKLLGIKVPRRM